MLHQHIPGSGKRHYQVADRGLTVDGAYLDREDRMIVWQDGWLCPVSGSRDAWDDRALVRGFESTFLSRAPFNGSRRARFSWFSLRLSLLPLERLSSHLVHNAKWSESAIMGCGLRYYCA